MVNPPPLDDEPYPGQVKCANSVSYKCTQNVSVSFILTYSAGSGHNLGTAVEELDVTHLFVAT